MKKTGVFEINPIRDEEKGIFSEIEKKDKTAVVAYPVETDNSFWENYFYCQWLGDKWIVLRHIHSPSVLSFPLN